MAIILLNTKTINCIATGEIINREISKRSKGISRKRNKMLEV
ncbi:MAG: hypothetical protein ACR5KW_00915 [Wolbachia sp.]